MQFLTLGGDTNSIWFLVLTYVLSKFDLVIAFFKQTFGEMMCAFAINM